VPAQAPQHAVERLDRVREALAVGEHAAQPARVRQRADEHIVINSGDDCVIAANGHASAATPTRPRTGAKRIG
jgi:hypothetical protein